MIIPHRKVVSNMLGMLTTNQYGGMTVVLSTAQLCFNRIPQSHNVVLVSSTSQNTFFFCITAVLFNKFLIISNAVDHCFAKGVFFSHAFAVTQASCHMLWSQKARIPQLWNLERLNPTRKSLNCLCGLPFVSFQKKDWAHPTFNGLV